MNNRIRIIDQYNKNISSHIRSGLYKPYLVTTMFNMINHEPDHIEGDMLNRIKHISSSDQSSPALKHIYNDLINYRFKINQSLNYRIYEKDINYKRVSWVWNQYDKLYSHLIQSLIKNSSRPNKIQLHPLTYDFMDVYGSKHHRHVWDDDGTLHIHSIYLVRNEIAGKFQNLMENKFLPVIWHPKLTGIREVHAEPIGPEPSDLSKAIEYAGKTVFGMNPLHRKDDLPLTNQFPIGHHERLIRRQEAKSIAAGIGQ